MNRTPDETREGSKQEEAVRGLRALARTLGPGAQLPKFLALREEMGVSGTTLTAALDELERQGVVVRRHGVGIYVSERLDHRSVVLLCDPAFFEGEASPFWEMLVRHARDRAAAKSEDLTLHFAPPAASAPAGVLLPQPLLAEIDARRVHGVLGVGLNYPTAEEIERRGLPFVAFAGYGRCSVAFDEAAMVRAGVRALAARGCRRVALWSSVPAHRLVCREDVLRRPTIPAFQEALAGHGLAFDPALVRTNAHLCPDAHPIKDGAAAPSVTPQEQGRDTAWEVFGPGSDPRLRPDGIVCTEDSMTQGALPLFARLGLRPGVDVQVATHSNAGSPTLFGYEESLVRMEADPARLVREMYDLLEARMAGETPERPQRSLEPSLRLPLGPPESQ